MIPALAPRSCPIRRIAPDDREPLARILAEGAPFDAEEIEVALELIDAAIGDPTIGYEALVATELDGTVIGYVCFGATPMTQGTYDLYWIVTDSACRGRGIARALVDDMERELRAREGRLVRVETSKLEAYGAARAFYAAIGYPVAAVLPDFYRVGDDLIVYCKAL